MIAWTRVRDHVVFKCDASEPQHYGATIAPLVVKDMVIAGVSGGDWGIRGFIDAYKAGTGERVWRHWTVPAKGDPGFDTWKGTAVTYGARHVAHRFLRPGNGYSFLGHRQSLAGL